MVGIIRRSVTIPLVSTSMFVVPRNLVLRSEALDHSYWTKTNSSITANVTTAPDSNTTADKIIEDSANAQHACDSGTIIVASNTTHTVSVYLKSAERTALALGWVSPGFTSGVTVEANLTAVTLHNGAAFGGGTYVGSTITADVGGWYRITLTGKHSAAGTSALVRLLLNNPVSTYTYTGNGTSGLYAWGVQVETGTVATTYVPTNG